MEDMNLHLKNLKQIGNMIYKDSRRIEEEEIVEGVSRSMLAAETFSEEEEDLSLCSLPSMCSSSGLTDDDDASSSSSSNGSLEDLSDLMSHLPINFMKENINHSHQYIANVKSLEDLMKTSLKNRNYGARRKSRSTVRIIINQSYKMVYSPKATISKKATTRTPSSALSCLPRRRL
ncbi:hypothetical protein HID58_088020 [Brassica napus]|uniref:Uncharacterized protein n=1 Tax=Brassica napus TaxID=3708 RepID=A0ABQ7XV01_BRANA|nr:hypothetical protein HID58_088020 [Brassica napus]